MCVRENSARLVAFVGGSTKTLTIPTVWRQASAAR